MKNMKKFNFSRENTFCISLESRPDRYSSMLKRFNHFNLDVTRWNASTASTLIDKFDNRLNEGEKGCSQSHLNIYKHIIENDLEYAFILEDDACFDKNWEEKLEQFDEVEWDLILLNGSEPIDNMDKWTNTEDNIQYLTGGYIISKNGAKWILEYGNMNNEYYSSDWMTSRLQYVRRKSYCYFPWLIIQEGFDSNLRSNVEEHQSKVIKCLSDINYPINNYII